MKVFRSFVLCLVVLSSFASCGGGGGGGGGSSDFAVGSINVPPGSVQRINRAIEIAFNQPVDFSTVNLNTINIRELSGVPSVGTFSSKDSRTVVFQPVCPTQPDFSDAGLRPGGVTYRITVVGASAGASATVRSRNGQVLRTSETRVFSTPSSTLPSEIFFDVRPGPPAPVLREVGSTELDATYVEIGGDPANRAYFELDPVTSSVVLSPPIRLPLNLLSAGETQIAVFLALDQPINPGGVNVSEEAVRFEFLGAGSDWFPISTAVELTKNCEGTGAVLKLTPEGMLPPSLRDSNGLESDATVRVVVTTLLQDLVGDANLVQLDSFAETLTEFAPQILADAFVEQFDTGGMGSFEDVLTPLTQPRASWGGGSLSAAFDFTGTGGPGGDFDWRVPGPPGSTFIFDTSGELLFGGPNFELTSTSHSSHGLLDVRNFEVPAGVTLRFQGADRVTILAAGSVRIAGTIELSGDNNLGVNNVATANIPEQGSPGQCGGGDGGMSSPESTQPSSIGLPGFGAFQAPLGGGGPGETGWGQTTVLGDRPGGGGGGGRLGRNQLDACQPTAGFDQRLLGLDAEEGRGGESNFGALDLAGGSDRYSPVGSQGGAVGSSPFMDPDPDNDFFGVFVDTSTNPPTFIEGELEQPSAGAGGGGGGNSMRCPGTTCVFPGPNFNLNNNQKGGAGGGGGGSIQIIALGDIVFEGAGQIRARGGFGGHGESYIYFNNVGGGGGGGSGGHVVLQALGKIDFSQMDVATPNAPNGFHIGVLATGGQGGSGYFNLGGAGFENPFGGPSQILEQFDNESCTPFAVGSNPCDLPDGTVITASFCKLYRGAGGDGGPGIVQLHTEGGLADVLLPPGMTIDEVAQPSPMAFFLPAVARRSVAQSEWIALGQGGFDAAHPSSFRPVRFDFAGTDPLTGSILAQSGEVLDNAPVLGPEPLQGSSSLPRIEVGGRTMLMDATDLMGTPEGFNPSRLTLYILELSETGAPENRARFEVAAALLDTEAVPPTVALTVASSDPTLDSFAPSGGVEVQLRPVYFRVDTQGTLDALPDTADIRLLFEAAEAGPGGLPLSGTSSGFVADPTSLNPGGANNPASRDWRFVRFRASFDIAGLDTPVTLETLRPSLRFLRIPIRY